MTGYIDKNKKKTEKITPTPNGNEYDVHHLIHEDMFISSFEKNI